MDFKQCSYCQRPYGSLNVHNKPTIRTFDHIKSKHELKHFKKFGRQGVMSRGAKSFAEVDDLLECCDECNLLKGSQILMQFQARLPIIAIQKRHQYPNHYLTDEMVSTIKSSINTLLYSIPEPILINIIE